MRLTQPWIRYHRHPGSKIRKGYWQDMTNALDWGQQNPPAIQDILQHNTEQPIRIPSSTPAKD